MKIVLFLLLLGAAPAGAQPIKFPASLDRLSKIAAESVDVTLDSNMLQFAARFLNGKDADEAKAKQLIAGLKGIYVRSFEFNKEGEYQEADVEAVRAQLRAPVWSRMVEVRSKSDGENVDVFLRTEAGKIAGLVVIAAEPKELTLVHIDGPIDPEQLAELSGHFGVPKLDLEGLKSRKETKK